MRSENAPAWMRWTLFMAGAYNLIWGSLIVAFPSQPFQYLGMEPVNYPSIWQCVGMIVGVYGVGYAVAATDPARHWPVVLVGFLGKIFGPIGFLQQATAGKLPWSFGWLNVTNDLIWWVPFGLILRYAYVQNTYRSPRTATA